MQNPSKETEPQQIWQQFSIEFASSYIHAFASVPDGDSTVQCNHSGITNLERHNAMLAGTLWQWSFQWISLLMDTLDVLIIPWGFIILHHEHFLCIAPNAWKFSWTRTVCWELGILGHHIAVFTRMVLQQIAGKERKMEMLKKERQRSNYLRTQTFSMVLTYCHAKAHKGDESSTKRIVLP